MQKYVKMISVDLADLKALKRTGQMNLPEVGSGGPTSAGIIPLHGFTALGSAVPGAVGFNAG